MESDLFASLRKRDTGVSTSFAPSAPQHAQHDEPAADTRAEPQISAGKHVEHEKHVSGKRSAENDRVVTVPGIRERDNDELPDGWRQGLNLLNIMRMPAGAERDRWREIVLDAHRFAWGWHVEAAADGWSIGSLFGLDPKQPHQDEAGLIFSIRGGWVVNMFKDEREREIASIKTADGHRYFYRRPVDRLPPIWTLSTIGHRR